MKSRVRAGIIVVALLALAGSVFLFERAGAQTSMQEHRIKPAGRILLDASTNAPAVMPLTFDFVRAPGGGGPDGNGRFVIAVNSGYGVMTNSKSKAQQTLSVIDLDAKPDPLVVQTVWFPSPQSANFGLVFDRNKSPNGRYNLYVAGGVENKVWMLAFDPANEKQPLAPSNVPDKPLEAPSIDVSAFSEFAPTPNYNGDREPVYPTGLGLAPDGQTLFVANNLADNLGVISDLRGARRIARVALGREGSAQFLYPYDVAVLPNASGKGASKIFVSLWGDGTVAVVDGATLKVTNHITVGRHPTKMLFNKDRSRLFVVNSDGDSVSVIDARAGKIYAGEPTIKVGLREFQPAGMAPEGIALSIDERRLYVSNAKVNAVAVIDLDPNLRLDRRSEDKSRSIVRGFVPSGNYPSALAVVGDRLLIANGKGTGMENSSSKANESGFYPNMPNDAFPAGASRRGIYSAVAVSGNVSVVEQPGEKQLFDYTAQVMRDNGLVGNAKKDIFRGGRSPFKHVVYVIRENRTYDQVFGDLDKSGDGTKADGDPSVAIFGAGDTAKSPGGASQNVTPNARALALRFGLLDRFFVNAEASPDGHNWSTAAFSNDYIDKAFRWNYSGRGRTYDFEGFNRLPSYDAPAGQPPVALPSVFDLPATAEDVAGFQKKYVPYLNGARDVGEPETLYLWDLAARNKLTYKAYGEYVATVSEADVAEVNTRKPKAYPDLSPTKTSFATKKSLEGHFSKTVRNFDMSTPDALTTDSYLAAVADPKLDPLVAANHANPKFRGSSRLGDFLDEFRGWADKRRAGGRDEMPNLSILRLSSDHTSGLRQGVPTPQFYVAENDYAIGRLVEEMSNSEYWKDTAIFILEDDAQDGPDHVDAHRSPAFVISAYNRKGALVHDFHNTVSLIRTMEVCLGLPPMNFLDAYAAPIDVFTSTPDLTPYKVQLPGLATDNLYPPARPSKAMSEYMRLTDRQDLRHADMANPYDLNRIIWFSVRGEEPMPAIARMPAYDMLKLGMKEEEEEEEDEADD